MKTSKKCTKPSMAPTGASYRLRLTCALLIAVLLGCTTGREREPEATVQVLGSEAVAGREAEADVSAEPGNILVTGALTAPDPCRDLDGLTRARDAGLVLRITVKRREVGMCAQVLTRYRYRASILNVAAGPHELTVIHSYEDSGWAPDTVVASRPVTVP